MDNAIQPAMEVDIPPAANNANQPAVPLPLYVHEIERFHCITRIYDFEDAWKDVESDDMDCVGLDCEFGRLGNPKSSKVALLQLTGPRCSILYHCALLEGEGMIAQSKSKEDSPFNALQETHCQRRLWPSSLTRA